jgi:hypothetical protein
MTILHSSVGRALRSKLDGLFLVQTGSEMSGPAVVALGGIGGVIVTGQHSKKGCRSTSASTIVTLRRSHPDLFLMWDAEQYATVNATKAAPFVLPLPGLFGSGSLPERLAEQRAMGVSMTLTPTAHLQALDVDSLQAVIQGANAELSDDILVHLPLDEAWLLGGSQKYVLDAVKDSRHPIAMSLASNRNPIPNREATEALQHLASESTVPLVLLRCDLAGLDFIARGGVCAAFGMSGGLRHAVSLLKPGLKIDIKDRRPSVLNGSLMDYFSMPRIDREYASVAAPACLCPECLGAALDRFGTDAASGASARRHNAHIALSLHSRLMTQVDMLGAWRAMVNEAQGNFLAEALRLGNAKFKEPAHFKTWAR